MKKFVVLAVIALVALSTASVALADNARGEKDGSRNGWFNIGRLFDKKDKQFKGDKRERTDERNDEDDGNRKGRPFGTCREDARTEMKTSMKTAFGTFMTAKKSAHDIRVAAIVVANGDQAKITAAWQTYQASYLTAWTAYSSAVYAAMKEFGTDVRACKVVTPTPTPNSQ